MTETTRPDTSNRDQNLDAVKAGTHSHWSAYDLGLEGTRWHDLEAIVSAIPFDAAAAEVLAAEIVAFGHGFGYGQADSYLTEFDPKPEVDEDDEDVVASLGDDYDEAENARIRLFDTYDETEYFENTFKSENDLVRESKTREALAFARGLANRVEQAFITGRDLCVSEFGVRADVVEQTTASPSL